MRTRSRIITATFFALITTAALAGEATDVLRKTPDWVRTDALWRSDAYLYDSAGNVKQIGTDKYRYDAAGRLIYATAATETEPGNGQDFVYDVYGNLTKITTRTAPAPVVPSSVYGYGASSATNQLTGTCPAGVVHCFKGIYDEAGNLTGSVNNGISNPGEYVWDALGALTDLQGSRRERYLYDASEERIGVIRYEGEVEVERRYTVRGADNKVARELSLNTITGAWTLTKDYVYRGNMLLAAYSGNASTTPDRHYHADHLGSTRLVTDAAGYKLAFHTYLPYGGEAAGSELDGERLKFTGHERDSNATYTGWDLDYMHARYYSPVTARFVSVDAHPAIQTRPQTWNRYSYTFGNPLRLVDPDGQWPTGTHNLMIDQAFPGLSWRERRILKSASRSIDNLKGQGHGLAYLHGMRAPGESIASAQRKAAAFYTEQIEQGQFLASFALGRLGALEPLGRVMHLVTDMTSPTHIGWQEWIIHELGEHRAGERRMPTQDEMNMAVAMMRAAYAEVFGVEAAERAASRPAVSRMSNPLPNSPFAFPTDGGTVLWCFDGACL